MATTHEVVGRDVRMPVEVRTAQAATAMFSVRADRAQAMIDGSVSRSCRTGRAGA